MTQEFTFEQLFSRGGRRVFAAVTLFFFTFTFYSPAVHAAYDLVTDPAELPANTLSSINPLGKELQDLSALSNKLNEVLKNPSSEHDLTEYLDAVALLRGRIQSQHELMIEDLSSERQHLLSSGVAETILNRHDEFAETYSKSMSAILNLTERMLAWDSSQGSVDTLRELNNELSGYVGHPVRNPQQSFSGDLDFIEPPPRAIYTSLSQVRSLLGVSGDHERPINEYLVTDPATKSTDRIVNLVNAIGPDPVALYNWVHDNVDYIPSYGVMQGADYTLGSEQGNAFDISSSLIALLREANIPARYQYGVVALPSGDVQNWVGGVVNVDAATNLLSQGGIPQRQMGYGGAIEEVELEHVWVEAYVDGEWVALDPSFKQYEYSSGLNLEEALPTDANSLVSDLEASANINEEAGWVQGIDVVQMQNALDDYAAELKSYVTAQVPDGTLGDVIGRKTIIPSDILTLDDVELPFDRVAFSDHTKSLPDNLHYRFQLQIGSSTGGSFGLPVQWDNTIAELNEATVGLVGHSLAINFRPATVADEQTIHTYIPDDIENLEDLPESIPANTINMIGEITIDGEIVAETGEVTLGQSLMTRLGYIEPESGWKYSENNLDVGVYQAIGLDMQGVSPAQLEALRNRLEDTRDILELGTDAEVSTLTKHDMLGDVLQTGIQGYLAETYAMDKVSAETLDIVHYRQPSYGTFSTAMTVAYFFGTPKTVGFSGVVMDVDRLKANNESKLNCYKDWVAFNLSSGMRSSTYEHVIPERLYSTEENPKEGVSTAKALAVAMAQGQRIYQLDSENSEQLSNVTIDDQARAEISKALSQGMDVTVHESPVNVGGWQGSGYSIINPDHGVGAYKISGGFSGGSLKTLWDYFMYWTNADGFPDWLKKGLGRLNASFSTLDSYLKIYNTEGCGILDAAGGAFLSAIAGSFLTKASLGLFFGVTGLFGLVIICLMVVLLSMIISYLTSLIVSGVSASCKNK